MGLEEFSPFLCFSSFFFMFFAFCFLLFSYDKSAQLQFTGKWGISLCPVRTDPVQNFPKTCCSHWGTNLLQPMLKDQPLSKEGVQWGTKEQKGAKRTSSVPPESGKAKDKAETDKATATQPDGQGPTGGGTTSTVSKPKDSEGALKGHQPHLHQKPL